MLLTYVKTAFIFRGMDIEKLYEGIDPCTDHGCIFRTSPSKGMGTNGGCRCIRNRPHLAERVLRRLQQLTEYNERR